jgi:hypothetical protein
MLIPDVSLGYSVHRHNSRVQASERKIRARVEATALRLLQAGTYLFYIAPQAPRVTAAASSPTPKNHGLNPTGQLLQPTIVCPARPRAVTAQAKRHNS